jgi:hypothetical protein
MQQTSFQTDYGLVDCEASGGKSFQPISFVIGSGSLHDNHDLGGIENQAIQGKRVAAGV